MNYSSHNPMIDPDSEPAVLTEAGGTKRRKTTKRASLFVLEGPNETVLEFIDKAMYVTSEQIAVLTGVTRTEAGAHLVWLFEYDLVGKKNDKGYPLVYFLTRDGKDMIDSDTSPVSEHTRATFARHAILTGWIMLSLIKGRGPMAQQIIKRIGFTPTLDNFATESEISFALGSEKALAVEAVERREVAAGNLPKAKNWQVDDVLVRTAIRGRRANQPWRRDWLFTIFGGHASHHIPDLVLEVPGRDASGAPRHIAFEVERSMKPRSVASMLHAYFTNLSEGPAGQVFIDDTATAHLNREGRDKAQVKDVRQYGNVVWVCGDAKIQTSVEQITNLVFGVNGPDNPLRKCVVMFPQAATREWAKEILAESNAERAEALKIRRAAVARGYFHILGDLKVKPCTCGPKCIAKYGAHPSEAAALDVVDELT